MSQIATFGFPKRTIHLDDTDAQPVTKFASRNIFHHLLVPEKETGKRHKEQPKNNYSKLRSILLVPVSFVPSSPIETIN